MGDYLRRYQFQAVYEGIGGDIMSAGLYMTPERLRLYRGREFDLLAEMLLPEKGEFLLKEMVDPGSLGKMKRSDALGYLSEEIKSHSEKPNPISSCFFWNRTRRSIALCPYLICDGPKFLYTPYLDWDVFRHLASLPAEMTLDTKFHDDTIARAFPEYSDIPYAEKTGRKSKMIGMMYYLNYLKDLLVQVSVSRSTLIRSGATGRIVRALYDRKYKRSVAGFAALIVYLTQLGQIARKHHVRD